MSNLFNYIIAYLLIGGLFGTAALSLSANDDKEQYQQQSGRTHLFIFLIITIGWLPVMAFVTTERFQEKKKNTYSRND